MELPMWTRPGWGARGDAEPSPWVKFDSGQWKRKALIQFGNATIEYREKYYRCPECGGVLWPLTREYRFGCKGCGLIFGAGFGGLWGYGKGDEKAQFAVPTEFLTADQLGAA